MSAELTTVQSIIDALFRFYIPDIYTIAENTDGFIEIKSKVNNISCGNLKFNIENKYIRVVFIDKCDTSGTQFLDYLELFAREYKYNISLMDVSTINVNNNEISLSRLKMLTTGQSWYNLKGYKSEQYDVEISHNLAFIHRPVEDLREIIVRGVNMDRENELRQNSIEYLTSQNIRYSKHLSELNQLKINKNLEKIKNNENVLRDIDQKYELMVELFDTIVVKTQDMTIQEFFIEIKNKLGSYTPHQITWVSNVINKYMFPYLLYNIELTNQINKGGGKRRKYNSKRYKYKYKIPTRKYKKPTRKYNKHKK